MSRRVVHDDYAEERDDPCEHVSEIILTLEDSPVYIHWFQPGYKLACKECGEKWSPVEWEVIEDE